MKLHRKSAMSAREYRNTLARLDLSQGQAAAVLGKSLRQAHGYANGDPVPVAVAKLLRLMLELKRAS